MTSEPTDRQPQPSSEWRIGRYRVEAVLGTGAFATVYLAVDERLEDEVAVKVLAENHSLDPETRKRFLTEGRVLRRIDSPHVIDVHDLGETERQQPFLVLEYAARGTLAQRVGELRAASWRPGPADVWAVAEPLARALDAIHQAGVVHRDVNPTNVLLTTRGAVDRARSAAAVRPDERLVLADLGLCKDLALHSGHTSAGGTEGFRPPELRGGPAIIDGRADLWSVSALLMWLATGSPPDGTPVGAAISAVGLPAGLARVLDRSLAEDPRTRHPDRRAWLSDVEAALSGQALGAPTSGTSYTADGGWSGPTGWKPPLSPAGWLPTSERPPAPTFPMAGSGAAEPAREWSPGWEATAAPGWSWRLRHSAWALTALPFGAATWAGFLYIGRLTGRTGWLWAAAAYGAGAILGIGFMIATPVGPDGNARLDSWQLNAATVVWLILWPVGIVHALVANRRWLRWRASSD